MARVEKDQPQSPPGPRGTAVPTPLAPQTTIPRVALAGFAEEGCLMVAVKYHRGVELLAHGIWLDPADPKPFAFVSHAHSDHIGNHQEIIASEGTTRLMRERMPAARIEHVLPFGQTRDVRGLRVTLLPAGHIFGSAQFHLETDRGSLLYTGDFKLRSGLSAEPIEWRGAETLIMETTYGLPKYRFPPSAEVLERIVAFCREALDEGATPVLLGYSLGKAQEILCALVNAGLQPMLHGSVYRMTEIYRQLNPDFPCGYQRYDAGAVAGKVLICPPSANRSIMLQKIKDRRTAVLTGWAMNPGAEFRYQCDAAFPLSDHADYTDLIRYVDLVQPQRVLTLHGFAGAFARDLRARGIEAWALTEGNQLELALPGRMTPVVASAPVADGPSPPPQSEFADFAVLCESIAATTSKLAKIELLAAYLQGVAVPEPVETEQGTPSSLAIAAVYLTGKAFAQADMRTLQAGWAVIRRALLGATHMGEQQFRDIANIHSDAGKTAYEVMLGHTRPEPFPLAESHRFFTSLHETRGPIAKTSLLQHRLSRLSPLEGQYLVKILTGDLRIGLKEGLVEEAIAAAFDEPLDEVKEANMLLGDIGATALLAQRRELQHASLQLFRPLKCMLASPEPTAESIWQRLPVAPDSPPAVWVEDKFDGIRAQLHRGAARAEIFSRDLRCVTGQFNELVRGAEHLKHDAIFDGEIVAFAKGRKLTFFDLQKRLGRKSSDDLFDAGDIPVVYNIFDLLFLDGRSLLREPLHERRRLLESINLPPVFERVPVAQVHSANEIEAEFQAARRRRNEGLIVKDAESIYTPGRRGLAWLKLKKELATLDVVVVGAEYGNGKRSHVLSDYTFSVRDDSTGALLTIGKAYSGLTDVEIEELTAHFLAHTVAVHGRYRAVKPDTVLEIAFDSVQRSTRHESGLALRFPRIKAIRRDKTPEMIDTVIFARSLVAANGDEEPGESR